MGEARQLPVSRDGGDTGHHAVGFLCGIGAGAVWGLVFLAPKIAADADPLLLTIGRYLCYGLIALVLLGPRWHSLRRHIHRSEWLNLAWLALAGNTVYYVLLSAAVQMGGIAMTSLIIGFLPVAVTLVGSRDSGAVSLRRLWPSLLLSAAGAVCIGWQAVAAPIAGNTGRQLIGLLCAIGALIAWTAYAIGNSRCLVRLKEVSAQDWNSLIGITTGAQAILLIPLAMILSTWHHSADTWLRLGFVSLAVAFLASIVGNALWNRMSQLLPLTLVGQMILFETAFALLYGFFWDRRLPSALEVAALTLVVLSVSSCVNAHRRPSSRAASG